MIPLMIDHPQLLPRPRAAARALPVPPPRQGARQRHRDGKAMADIGIDVRDPTQAVGTLSGGERQSVAIARAIHFGAKVLILDEPTSALGVHQAAMVLKFVIEARLRGLAVVFITHNIHHAYPVGDVFTLLNRGRRQGTYRKDEITRDEVMAIMSGGEDLRALEGEIEALLASIAREGAPPARPLPR